MQVVAFLEGVLSFELVAADFTPNSLLLGF